MAPMVQSMDCAHLQAISPYAEAEVDLTGGYQRRPHRQHTPEGGGAFMDLQTLFLDVPMWTCRT